MDIIKVGIGEIKLNPENPRVIKDDKFKKLVNSIKEFPEMLEIRPIVVNSEMIVLGGNQRLKACKDAGLKEVFIIKASDLSEAQQKEFAIKDNANYGEWDWEEMQLQFELPQLEDWGIDIPKFEVPDFTDEEKEDIIISDKKQKHICPKCGFEWKS